MPLKPHLVACRTVAIYIVIGVLWILLSDYLLFSRLPAAWSAEYVAMAKGVAFVLVTGGLIYILLMRVFRRWEAEAAARGQAEQALDSTTTLLEAVVAGATDAIFVKDREGRYLLFNEAAARYVGRPVGAVLGRDDSDLFDPEGVQSIMARDRATMESGEVFVGEEMLTSAGMTRTYHVIKVPYRDRAGRIAGLIGISRDITERKTVERELVRTNERLRLALDAARMGVWEWNVPTGAILWSPECHAIMGVAEFGGRIEDFAALLHPEDAERVMGGARAALAARQPFAMEFRIQRPDGLIRWVANAGRGTYSEDGQPLLLVGTVQDITERREMEAQFRQAQKMEAIGQLAGGVAHDFNNILTVIQSYITLLEQGLVSHEEAGVEINQAVERATGLSRQLLTFSRKQVMQERVLDLNEVVTDMTRMLRRTIGADVMLSVVTAPAPQLILADRGMMEQVLLNLAVNSRDAMPSGGRLEIATDTVLVDEEAVRTTSGARRGPAVCLRVSDSGAGIAPEVLGHIFEPFFTTKHSGKGTGLGLATVHGIVQQHHGWIQVRSSVGSGTTFEILLPALPPRPATEERREALPETLRGTETILLVDDETALRAVVRSILVNLGYRVIEAPSGRQALDLVATLAEPVDVLVSDMVMPEGVSGRQLAQELRARWPGLSVVLMSGYSVEFAGQVPAGEPRTEFLQKPFSATQLSGAIRRVLAT